MNHSDERSAEQSSDGECCKAHEVLYGAGRPCANRNWRCVLREVVDKFLKKDPTDSVELPVEGSEHNNGPVAQ